MEQQHKDASYSVDLNYAGKSKYKCSLCNRSLSSKQRILHHLTVAHKLSPVKRVKKKYADDPSAPIPSRTLRRKKALFGNAHSPVNNNVEIESRTNEYVQQAAASSTAECNISDARTDFGCFQYQSELDQETEFSSDEFNNTESDLSSSCDDQLSEFSDDSYENSAESSSASGDEDRQKSLTDSDISPSEMETYCLLSCIMRHNLTASAACDIVEMVKALYPRETSLTSYKDSLHGVINGVHKTVHYCNICNMRFLEDPNVYLCQTEGCSGLRYKGDDAAQTKFNKIPVCAFIIADIPKQLTLLLKKKDVYDCITRTKVTVLHSMMTYNATDENFIIRDVVDGLCYRQLCQPGQFLAKQNAYSGIFNTDGIPLFSSSKVKLWPIFIAINELNPSLRFRRENMILAGIWQGQTKPPFFEYLSAFGEDICRLYNDGVNIDCNSTSTNIKFGIFLGTVDLQAKAYITNMSMHNGSFGCITCEEPGKTVKQGKGTSRCYPYRDINDRPPRRTSHQFIESGITASSKNRDKGVCGPSGLMCMPFFDLILGCVPDYMHGALLGVTKALLKKMLSPTNSGKQYFVGKHISNIARRVLSIRPPDFIERVPRNLENHYQNLKASELEAWLLYYSLPCLHGYLDYNYLQHFAKLSEGIHILLGDSIRRSDMKRATILLDEFYKDFAVLYGEGSCGLNVHNVGAHMSFYVEQWGPIFGWSCFGFEDANADILSFAHGTRDVTQQILRMKEAHMVIASSRLGVLEDTTAGKFFIRMRNRFSKKWHETTPAFRCRIAGACSKLNVTSDVTTALVKSTCNVMHISELQETKRIQVGEEKYYSRRYTKMYKRNCHVVLCANGHMVTIHMFIFNPCTKEVYVLGNKLVLAPTCYLCTDAGHHLLRVLEQDELVIFSVSMLVEKLFYMNVDGQAYVSRAPNRYGHGVLK